MFEQINAQSMAFGKTYADAFVKAQTVAMEGFERITDLQIKTLEDRVNAAVQRAAQQGNRQLLAVTFPATYCNDRGRRINNLESDWPDSLEGFAKKAYDFYMAELKPLGFKLTAQILDYPGGMPGRVGLFLSWG